MSVGEAVDVGFAVAIATHQLGAQRVELVEASTSIGRDPRLELGDRLGQREELRFVERLQSTEPVAGAELVELDGERRAAMVSNLLVVLCSDRHTQPVVNTGTLYT